MKKYIFKEIQISLRTVRVFYLSHDLLPLPLLFPPGTSAQYGGSITLSKCFQEHWTHDSFSYQSRTRVSPRRLASLISSGSMLQKLYSMQAQLKGPEFPPILFS